MDTRIRDAIDRSIGEPPPAPSLDTLLEGGRRASKGRRVAVGSSVACATAVTCVAVAVIASGGTDRAAPPISSTGGPTVVPTMVPSHTPSPSPSTLASKPPPVYTQPEAPVARRTPLEGNSGVDAVSLVDYGTNRRVYVYPRATLLRWVDNPYHLPAPMHSDAVAVAFRGTTYFYVLLRSSDTSSSSARIAQGPWCPTLQDWIHRQRASAGTVR